MRSAPAEWQSVPLAPREEPLVKVESDDRVLVQSAYWARGYQEALEDVYLRREVNDRLLQAASLLPANLCLLVWDGWRPLSLQERLHREFSSMVVASSGISGSALRALVNRYVSEPSADPRHPSPHLTGGAVDLTLAGAGSALDMGSDFDAFEPMSSTDYFERNDGLSDEELLFRDRRKLLCRIMSEVGFSNYPEEWWHFDLGNQFWGLRRKKRAYYGAIGLPE